MRAGALVRKQVYGQVGNDIARDVAPWLGAPGVWSRFSVPGLTDAAIRWPVDREVRHVLAYEIGWAMRGEMWR